MFLLGFFSTSEVVRCYRIPVSDVLGMMNIREKNGCFLLFIAGVLIDCRALERGGRVPGARGIEENCTGVRATSGEDAAGNDFMGGLQG